MVVFVDYGCKDGEPLFTRGGKCEWFKLCEDMVFVVLCQYQEAGKGRCSGGECPLRLWGAAEGAGKWHCTGKLLSAFEVFDFGFCGFTFRFVGLSRGRGGWCAGLQFACFNDCLLAQACEFLVAGVQRGEGSGVM